MWLAAYVDCTEQELIDWAKQRIAGFKVPRHIAFVASFDDVLTGSGKPRKELLRQRALARWARIPPSMSG